MTTEAQSPPLPSTPPAAPGWLGAWLALLPAGLVLGVLGFFGAGGLRRLPPSAQWLIGLYALSQLLPAAFAPDPMLALIGAVLRTTLMAGLLGIGATLGTARALAPVGLGLMVVYITAIYSAVTTGQDIYITRLSHPYMTSTTLGLAGAIGVWLALFGAPDKDSVAPFLRLSHWLEHPLWRTLLGLTGALVMVASGSRGALLAAAVGIAAGALRERSRLGVGVLALLAMLGGGAVWLGQRFGISALARFSDTASSGRDLIWDTVSEVVRAYPISGVGSYGLGRYLQLPQACQMWVNADGIAAPCPAPLAQFTERIGSPWLIAHSGFLQPLAETGPLGTAGLMALFGLALYAAWKGRQPLVLAIIAGLLVGNITDNLVLVPSPFFAELFWVASGIALVRGLGTDFRPAHAGLVGGAVAAALAFPVWSPTSRASAAPPTLLFLDAPHTIRAGEQYSMTAQFGGQDGDYRAVLSSCQAICTPVGSQLLRIRKGQTELVEFKALLRDSATQKLRLNVYAGETGAKAPLLAQRTWKVTRK